MKLINKNGLRILTPASKKFIATTDKTEVFEGEIYLGKFDSEKNYVEIDKNEKNKIIEAQEKERLAYEQKIMETK